MLVPLVAVAALLVAVNIAAARATGWAYIGINLAAAAAVLAVAWWAGFTAAELGLAWGDAGSGLGWGLAAAAVVVVAFTIAAVVPATRKAFRDARVARETTRETLVRALVTVPLGTVVLEEIAFRSVLLAVIREGWGVVLAVVASSLLFGLWHVRSAGDAHESNPHATDALRGTHGRILAIASVVVATGAAGAVLCGLRLGSGSVIAPAILHWAVNSTGLVLAMAVLHHDRHGAGAASA